MSEVCPFLKEMKSRDRDPVLGLWFDPNSIQDTYRTQGPVFLELSIYSGSQIRNSHRRHTLRTFSC